MLFRERKGEQAPRQPTGDSEGSSIGAEGNIEDTGRFTRAVCLVRCHFPLPICHMMDCKSQKAPKQYIQVNIAKRALKDMKESLANQAPTESRSIKWPYQGLCSYLYVVFEGLEILEQDVSKMCQGVLVDYKNAVIQICAIVVRLPDEDW